MISTNENPTLPQNNLQYGPKKPKAWQNIGKITQNYFKILQSDIDQKTANFFKYTL